MNAMVRGEQLFVFFESHDEQAFAVFNVLTLYKLLDHLRVKEHFDGACVNLILVFAPREHVLDIVCVFDSLVCSSLEVTLPSLAFVCEVFVFLVDTVHHQGDVSLVVLQTILEVSHVSLVDVDALKE